MQRKWITLIIILVIAGLIFGYWQGQKKTNVIVNILDSIPYIDAIAVKDGNTKQEIVTFTNVDPSFSDMVDVYDLPYYHKLKWSERKLLRGKPFVVVEYLKDNETQYEVSIYQVKEDNLSYMQSIDKVIQTDILTPYSYSYSPTEKNTTYIFAIRENHQLLGVNEGLKELLNTVISKTK